MIVPLLIPIIASTASNSNSYSQCSRKPSYKYSEKRVTSEYFNEVIVYFKLKDDVKRKQDFVPNGFWKRLFYISPPKKRNIIKLGFRFDKTEIDKLKDDAFAKEYIKENDYFIKVVDWSIDVISSLHDYVDKNTINDIIENYEVADVKDLGPATWYEKDYSKRDVYE